MPRALVEQRLDVAFGEHAAPRSDRVNLLAAEREGVELFRGHVEQGGHLVDERAGPARAGAVHPLLQPAGEKDDLGVLPAQLDHRVGIRRHRLDHLAGREHLLNERQARRFREPQPRRTRKRNRKLPVADHIFCHPDQLERLGAHLRKMPFVLFIDDIARLDDHDFYGGRADVNSNRHSHFVFPFRWFRTPALLPPPYG